MSTTRTTKGVDVHVLRDTTIVATKQTAKQTSAVAPLVEQCKTTGNHTRQTHTKAVASLAFDSVIVSVMLIAFHIDLLFNHFLVHCFHIIND